MQDCSISEERRQECFFISVERRQQCFWSR